MTSQSAIAREKTLPRFENRMVLMRAYRKLNRVIVKTMTNDGMDAEAFRQFATIIDKAQTLLRLEVELSGGDFDALYDIALREVQDQRC